MHLHRDILAGALFVAIGALALLGARGYPVGTAMRMGPGYLPVVLGWLLIALGALVGLRAARRRDWQAVAWDWKPLAWISVSILAFGFLMPRLGLVPALAVMFPAAWPRLDLIPNCPPALAQASLGAVPNLSELGG